MSHNERVYRGLTTILCGLLLVISVHSRAEIPPGALWVDVRSPTEYASGHLEGATLIPFDGIEAGVTRLDIEKDTPIYLYCAVGGRAEVAKKRLEALNYTRVVNVGSLENARRLQSGKEPAASQ